MKKLPRKGMRDHKPPGQRGGVKALTRTKHQELPNGVGQEDKSGRENGALEGARPTNG